MRDSDMQKNIARLHGEIDDFLKNGDKESYIKLVALMTGLWKGFIERDSGLKYTNMFMEIWCQESVTKECTILADVKSVEELLLKYRRIRFSLWRLENDFPDELCLESMQSITDMRLSSIAFQHLLSLVVEDEARVLARISEVSGKYK